MISGMRLAKPIADQVFVNNLLERPDALASGLAEVVKPFYQLAAPLLFGVLRHGLFRCPQLLTLTVRFFDWII